MPQFVEWYLPQRVVYSHVWGRLGIDDILTVLENSAKLRQSSVQVTHVIANWLSVEGLPGNVMSLRRLMIERGIPEFKYNGRLMVVSGNVMLRSLINLTARLGVVNVPIYVTFTMDEACQHLQKVDPTLPTLPPFDKWWNDHQLDQRLSAYYP